MRVFVLVLAILLLPLRGWMGNAMAMDTSAHAEATRSSTGHRMNAGSGTAHDCHGAKATSLTDHGPTTPDCQTSCANCQLCSSVALTAWPELAVFREAPHTAPEHAPVAFASAEPAPGLKPPIS